MSYFDMPYHVRRVYQLAGRHPAVPRGAYDLVTALFGHGAVIPSLLPIPDAQRARFTATANGQRCIVPRHIAPEHLSMWLYEAVAHWYAQHFVSRAAFIPWPEFIAGIAMPEPAIRILTEMLLYDAPTIARMFKLPQRVVDIAVDGAFCPSRSGQYPRVVAVGE